MANWLEEAEREIRRKSKTRHSERAKIKQDRISENYEIIREQFHEFVDELQATAERVNSLPLKLRDPFGQIDFKEKIGRYQNKLIMLIASRRLKKRKNTLSVAHFKNVRSFLITVSKYSGKVDIEIKEQFLIKKRLSTKNLEESDSPDNKKLSLLLSVDIAECTKEKVIDIVSYLAFKHDVEGLPFDLTKALVKE